MQSARRKFLLLAAAGAGVCSFPWLAGRWRSSQQPTITRTSWALGTDLCLTVTGLSKSQASRALDAAFAEIELVEQTMSIYRPESQLSRLNRDRVLERPHPHLLTVLATAEQTARETGGAFDISVQPLWNLYAAAKRAANTPTPAEIAAAQHQVDWRKIELSRNFIRLHEPVEAITLNGIAQGFALDRAVAVLKDHGATSALLNTGEISSLGMKNLDDPWTVGIQHPRESDVFIAVADLDGRALATSGDYQTTFSADFAKNHIFDPRTGESPTELASASIVAPTGLQADALSTAAMVLGRERTLAYLARLPNVDALLVDKNGNVSRTPGFPAAV